jgi:hypothetical protein
MCSPFLRTQKPNPSISEQQARNPSEPEPSSSFPPNFSRSPARAGQAPTLRSPSDRVERVPSCQSARRQKSDSAWCHRVRFDRSSHAPSSPTNQPTRQPNSQGVGLLVCVLAGRPGWSTVRSRSAARLAVGQVVYQDADRAYSVLEALEAYFDKITKR